MLLEIASNHEPPPTDLCYLLHKKTGARRRPRHAIRSHTSVLYRSKRNPLRIRANARCQSRRAHLRQRRYPNRPLRPVRHDCPCAASSFLSVALAKALRTALGGRGQENQQLVDRTIPLEATVTPLRASGRSNLARQLFEPGDTRSGSRRFPGCEFTRHLGCQSLRRVATRRQLPAAGSAVASLCADPRARLAQGLLHRHPRDRKAEATVIAPIPHIRGRRNIILCLQPEVCVPSSRCRPAACRRRMIRPGPSPAGIGG